MLRNPSRAAADMLRLRRQTTLSRIGVRFASTAKPAVGHSGHLSADAMRNRHDVPAFLEQIFELPKYDACIPDDDDALFQIMFNPQVPKSGGRVAFHSPNFSRAASRRPRVAFKVRIPYRRASRYPRQ